MRLATRAGRRAPGIRQGRGNEQLTASLRRRLWHRELLEATGALGRMSRLLRPRLQVLPANRAGKLELIDGGHMKTISHPALRGNVDFRETRISFRSDFCDRRTQLQSRGKQTPAITCGLPQRTVLVRPGAGRGGIHRKRLLRSTTLEAGYSGFGCACDHAARRRHSFPRRTECHHQGTGRHRP
jgi:hypothetical protein